MVRKAKKTGGSVASDAVEALVHPETWPVLNDRFTNYTHNFAAGTPATPSANLLDAVTLATGGGCGCSREKHSRGGGKGKRRGGTVPASLPIGAETHGSLYKHSTEASFNAAAPNVSTFLALNKDRYGHPPPVTAASSPSDGADAAASGGAAKTKSKSKCKAPSKSNKVTGKCTTATKKTTSTAPHSSRKSTSKPKPKPKPKSTSTSTSKPVSKKPATKNKPRPKRASGAKKVPGK